MEAGDNDPAHAYVSIHLYSTYNSFTSRGIFRSDAFRRNWHRYLLVMARLGNSLAIVHSGRGNSRPLGKFIQAF